jgi:hypothetical protein
MTYQTILKAIGRAVSHTSHPKSGLKKITSPFSSLGRYYANSSTENIKKLFPKPTKEMNALAFLAGSAALTAAGITTNSSLLESQETRINQWMETYGNQLFLECMGNDLFRETIQKAREAESLYYGIAYEKNENNTIFYRGMFPPSNIDENDSEKIKIWQDDLIQSMNGRGFSPLLWLTRPSATKAEGFNTHPHDGNVARADAPEAPASWSAAVTAMTCDFDLNGYNALKNDAFNRHGCIILAAPESIKYLSKSDIKSRHTPNIAHEFEVITPHIKSSEIVGLLMIEDGRVSRLVINENIDKKTFEIDAMLTEQLEKLLPNASPEAQEQLTCLISTLKSNSQTVDLKKKFDEGFNHSVHELLDATKKDFDACDQAIARDPLIRWILGSVSLPRKLASPNTVANTLGVELGECEPCRRIIEP